MLQNVLVDDNSFLRGPCRCVAMSDEDLLDYLKGMMGSTSSSCLEVRYFSFIWQDIDGEDTIVQCIPDVHLLMDKVEEASIDRLQVPRLID